MDKISKKVRSKNMSAIKCKNTSLEMIVRRLLHSFGYRYRLHVKNLYGKPDILIKKYNTVIFVNGCFWHQHKDCKYSNIPKSNTEFWNRKLQGNMKRDEDNINKLKLLGYNVLIIWECEIFNKSKKEVRFNYIKDKLSSVLGLPGEKNQT